MIGRFYPLLADTCKADGFIPSLYRGLCTGSDRSNPVFTSLSDIWIVILNVVAILIALSGMLAILFIIAGAIFYVTSAGDASRVKRAKDTIAQSITGLLLVIVSYSVVIFIADRL